MQSAGHLGEIRLGAPIARVASEIVDQMIDYLGFPAASGRQKRSIGGPSPISSRWAADCTVPRRSRSARRPACDCPAIRGAQKTTHVRQNALSLSQTPSPPAPPPVPTAWFAPHRAAVGKVPDPCHTCRGVRDKVRGNSRVTKHPTPATLPGKVPDPCHATGQSAQSLSRYWTKPRSQSRHWHARPLSQTPSPPDAHSALQRITP